jgi:putative glutamine amidotransferase
MKSLSQLEGMESQFGPGIAAMLDEQRAACSAPRPSRDRPRVGVFAARGTQRDGAWQGYCGDLYTVEAIAEAGGSPLALPTYPIVPGVDPFDILQDEALFRFIFDTIWPIMRDLDGLILTGGGDLDSRFFYRKVPHPRLQPPDLWRDTWEWFATLIAWATCKTTFGICRGLQLMNVALGGGLFQDQQELRKYRRDEMPPLLAHRRGRPIFKNFIGHPLIIVAESWLAQAVRGKAKHAALHYYLDDVWTQHHNFVGILRPNSMEVIGDLACGLVVAGYSPDRVIEAIASQDPQRVYVAVQFHPEYQRTLAWASCIFSYIVEAAARDADIDRSKYEAFRTDILAWLWQCARSLHDLSATKSAAGLASANGHAAIMRQTDELHSTERDAAPVHAG